MKRRISPRFVAVAAITAVVTLMFALAIVIGHKQGAQTGEQNKLRLELVWPSFMALSVTDRALLAGFALTCGLEREPPISAVVIACLREASGKADAVRPKGMDQTGAADRLEALITQAQEK